MNWGTKIIIVMSVFVAGIFYMVFTCMRQTDIQLVAPDYYEQEIAYQGVIDKENNYRALEKKPLYKDDVASGDFVVDFSMLPDYTSITGKIKFFRPSESKKDFYVEIEPDANGIQKVDKENLTPGKWIIKLDWDDGSKQYYNEQTMFIQ